MKCYVPGCGNNYNAFGPKLETYHFWTKDPNQRKVWLRTFGMNYVPTHKARICSTHFDYPDDFVQYKNASKIKKSAVPKYRLGPRTHQYASDEEIDLTKIKHISSMHLNWSKNRKRILAIQAKQERLKSEQSNTADLIPNPDEPSRPLTEICADMCRVCARQSADNVPLFKSQIILNMVGQRLSRLIQVDIQPNDGLPVTICTSCNHSLNQLMNFHQSAREMHYKYLDLIENQSCPKAVNTHIGGSEDTVNSVVINLLNIDGAAAIDIKPPVEETLYKSQPNETVPTILDYSYFSKEIEPDADKYMEAFVQRQPNKRRPLQQPVEKPSTMINWSDNSSNDGSRTEKEKEPVFEERRPLQQPVEKPSNMINWSDNSSNDGSRTEKEKEPEFKVKVKRIKYPEMVQCDLCQKILKKHSLPHHYSRHSSERNEICPVCSKGFKNASDLKIHMRTHTGVRKYICDVCGSAFRNNSAMVNHVRQHQTARNFKCANCPKAFKTRIALRRHIEATHEKKFDCPICNKPYGTRSRTIEHLKSHSRAGMDIDEALEQLRSIVIPHYAEVRPLDDLMQKNVIDGDGEMLDEGDVIPHYAEVRPLDDLMQKNFIDGDGEMLDEGDVIECELNEVGDVREIEYDMCDVDTY